MMKVTINTLASGTVVLDVADETKLGNLLVNEGLGSINDANLAIYLQSGVGGTCKQVSSGTTVLRDGDIVTMNRVPGKQAEAFQGSVTIDTGRRQLCLTKDGVTQHVQLSVGSAERIGQAVAALDENKTVMFGAHKDPDGNTVYLLRIWDSGSGTYRVALIPKEDTEKDTSAGGRIITVKELRTMFGRVQVEEWLGL